MTCYSFLSNSDFLLHIQTQSTTFGSLKEEEQSLLFTEINDELVIT